MPDPSSTTPAAGSQPHGHKRTREQLKTALREQHVVANDLQNELRESNAERDMLKEQLAEYTEGPPAKQAAPSHSLEPQVTQLGRAVGALNLAWVPRKAWAQYDMHTNNLDDDPMAEVEDPVQQRIDDAQGEPNNDHNDYIYNCFRLLLEIIPDYLKPYQNKKWFISAYQSGIRSIKSQCINKTKDVHTEVFGADVGNALNNTKTKEERQAHPEVKAQLNKDNFLYANGVHRLEWRTLCATICVICHGPKCLEYQGRPAPRAPHTNADLWGTTEATRELVAFAATIVYFHLLGEREFSPLTASANLRDFYRKRIAVLEELRDHKPTKYATVMARINSRVFPDHHKVQEAPEGDRTEDRELFDLIHGDDSDDESA